VPPLPLFGLSAIFERGEVVTLDASGVLALLYVVVLSTLGGFGAWVWLLRQHSASTVAPFSLLVPVFGIGSAWLFLSEAPSATELLGAGVVLVGLSFTVGLTIPRRKREAEPCASPANDPRSDLQAIAQGAGEAGCRVRSPALPAPQPSSP
jgi:O-acetylserine/cysteine efflux transporter